MSATFWTIWIVRNGCAFRSERKIVKKMEFLLKSTFYKWMRTKGWIQSSSLGLDNIWFHYPLSFLKIQTINIKDNLMKLLLNKYDLVGFVDGSWSNLSNNLAKAGIGGVVFSKMHSIIFLFSRPCSTISPFEAELKSRDFLIHELKRSVHKGVNIIICTNSTWAQEDFYFKKLEDLELINFYITKYDRNLILDADYLAKEMG